MSDVCFPSLRMITLFALLSCLVTKGDVDSIKDDWLTDNVRLANSKHRSPD